MKRFKRTRHGHFLVPAVWLMAFVSVGLWLLLGSHSQATDPQARSAPPRDLAAASSTPNRGAYQPIESIHVGQRVVTLQTQAGSRLPTAVDPATWQMLSLRLVTNHPGGFVDTTQVQTLQPPQWLAEHQARVGGRVPIPLDLKEMGVEDVPAEVMSIDPCPAIADGPGRVVLTTVNHLNTYLFDLSVLGERSPPTSVMVTGYHKLYSEDRAAWVSVCELKAGEKLRGHEGALTVASVRHLGTFVVYNMTVEGEHQYYVSASDLLAHNANCRFVGEPNGTLVDTDSTPQGSYNQPDGGRTDILQGHDAGAGYSHTHDSTINTVPGTGQSFVNGVQYPGRPVSARNVNNIISGAAKRRPGLGR